MVIWQVNVVSEVGVEFDEAIEKLVACRKMTLDPCK
jgi:hypothetical protein